MTDQDTTQGWGGFLALLAKRMERLADQDRIIRRSVQISGQNADRLREETLISGALPDEFDVVFIFRSDCGWAGMEASLR